MRFITVSQIALCGMLSTLSIGCVTKKDIDTNKLKEAIEYGISSSIYWRSDGLFQYECDGLYLQLLNKRGRETVVDVNSIGNGEEKAGNLWVEFKDFKRGNYLLSMTLRNNHGKLLFDNMDGEKYTSTRSVVKDMNVTVRRDWREKVLSEKIKLEGEEREKMMKALHYIFIDSSKKDRMIGAQHFYVGPYGMQSCFMYVYWVEKDGYWRLPISPTVFNGRGELDYMLAAPYYIFQGARREELKGKCDRDRYNCVILNCKKDGNLFEISP